MTGTAHRLYITVNDNTGIDNGQIHNGHLYTPRAHLRGLGLGSHHVNLCGLGHHQRGLGLHLHKQYMSG